MSPANVAFLAMVIAAFATFVVVLGSVAIYVRLAPANGKEPRTGPDNE